MFLIQHTKKQYSIYIHIEVVPLCGRTTAHTFCSHALKGLAIGSPPPIPVGRNQTQTVEPQDQIRSRGGLYQGAFIVCYKQKKRKHCKHLQILVLLPEQTTQKCRFVFPKTSLRPEKVNRAKIDSFKSENCFRNSLWSTSSPLSVFL